jgi:hypothetical protein
VNKGSFGDTISIKSLEKKENWGKSLVINDLFVSVPVYLPQVAKKIKPPVMTGSVSSPVATKAKIYKLLSSPYRHVSIAARDCTKCIDECSSIVEPSCCKKRQKRPNQETGLRNRGRLKVLNDTKLILSD